ncbi:oligosaccharide flippase family protein [Serratia proteamaculans]|uniref:oligosaccharide flippase family protein n=1 Tax=Serratia proteamaculans TaxID=28151 RepID=UPI0039AEB3DF
MISHKYRNAIWMMLEKIISILGLFLVTSYVAKYIGPELFGKLSIAMAVFQIVQIISQLGSDNILFKRISKSRTSGVHLMRASFYVRVLIYLFLSIPVIAYFYFFVGGYSLFFALAVCIACFFSAMDIYAIYNNAILQSKRNTICNAFGLAISLIIRYVVAYKKLDPVYLSIPIVLATAIPFFIRYFYFRARTRSIVNIITKRNTMRYSKYMVLAGSGIVISAISVALYARINQLELASLIGDESVGVYSVALTLATSWGFVVASLISSFYPAIFSEKDPDAALRMASSLNRLVMLVSIIALGIVTIFGQFVIDRLFGKDYVGAYLPMLILCVGSVLSSLGTVSYRFIVKYSGYAYLSKKMFIVFLISIFTSYFLILNHGVIGAAISVVIVELLSLTVMNYFFKKGLIMKLHAYSFFKGG